MSSASILREIFRILARLFCVVLWVALNSSMFLSLTSEQNSESSDVMFGVKAISSVHHPRSSSYSVVPRTISHGTREEFPRRH